MKYILINIIFLTLLYSQNLQKAKVYRGYENINGWFMSEKLDGVRGYWNGKELKTKNGNIIYAPKWFIKKLPKINLDGELWTKRGDFENIQDIVLDKSPSPKWKEITYNIFEVPFAEGNFSQRLLFAKRYIKNIKFIKIIKQRVCHNKSELKKFLQDVLEKDGEGVIIKNPKLPYFEGRSSNILKVKKYLDDEGKVIAINKGKGKFLGLMGSITLKLRNGITFKLGSGFSMRDRINPPSIGDMVTFKYYGLSKNKIPKFASFIRVRKSE